MVEKYIYQVAHLFTGEFVIVTLPSFSCGLFLLFYGHTQSCQNDYHTHRFLSNRDYACPTFEPRSSEIVKLCFLVPIWTRNSTGSFALLFTPMEIMVCTIFDRGKGCHTLCYCVNTSPIFSLCSKNWKTFFFVQSSY